MEKPVKPSQLFLKFAKLLNYSLPFTVIGPFHIQLYVLRNVVVNNCDAIVQYLVLYKMYWSEIEIWNAKCTINCQQNCKMIYSL